MTGTLHETLSTFMIIPHGILLELRVREGEVGRRKPGHAQWKKKPEIRGKDGRKCRLWLRIK